MDGLDGEADTQRTAHGGGIERWTALRASPECAPLLRLRQESAASDIVPVEG